VPFFANTDCGGLELILITVLFRGSRVSHAYVAPWIVAVMLLSAKKGTPEVGDTTKASKAAVQRM
jgi:hypothetical protein